MSISTKVSVNTHYTRSVNLERDADVIAITQNYIPTSRALRTFKRISETFSNKSIPRAWSWVGPYGSGKSSASAFLGQLLSNPNTQGFDVAQQVLGKASDEISRGFNPSANNTKGWLKVFLTGSPESLGSRLVAALHKAALSYVKVNKIPFDDLLAVSDLVQKNTVTTTEVVGAFQALQTALENQGCPGILLIIDELGKFLEYEARHYGANDIYLLQALAEHASKGQGVNLNVIVLLHQSFEQYAKGLGENLKNEWSKVQGRFEEVPFIESAEQVLRVVAAAFQHDFTIEESNQIKKQVKKIVSAMAKQGSLPSGLNEAESNTLFVSCYPLHPVSATLLPMLCQKVAQNERTLFSYLGSGEDFGMLDMLNKLDGVGSFVNPHSIYDYFITNQASSIGDYLTHRRWAEVVTALERLDSDEELDAYVLKTIGLLNIIGSKGGFKPSGALLDTIFKGVKSSPRKSVSRLEAQSIVTYRHYSGEYRVWQGSDFDLEEALQIEKSNLGKFALAAELNKSSVMLPIVARRYTIENGALRFFQPSFIDAASYKTVGETSGDPRILFYLAGDKEDEQIFSKEVHEYFSPLDIVALCLNGTQLREAVYETQALRQVSVSCPKMHSDPVAKKEFDDRLTSAEMAENDLLSDLLNKPETARWYHNNIDISVTNKRGLQEELSSLLEIIYEKAPSLHNELINRDRPSAQAVSARNKLLSAMLSHAGQSDLGIEKFPPEKSLYRSLLKQTGLHSLDKKTNLWGFRAPSISTKTDKNKSNLLPVWAEIDAFLARTEAQERSFVELNSTLMAAPYGVKAGVLPILYVSAFLVNQHELAIFENNRYRPSFTQEMAERFIKAPAAFTFQRVRVEGLRASIFNQYVEALDIEESKKTLLGVARVVAGIFGNLPDYTLKTQDGLPKEVIEVRTVFQLAKSPEKLLLTELPQALGFPGADELHVNKKAFAGFSNKLREVIYDLQNAHVNLKAKQLELICLAFGQEKDLSISKSRGAILERFQGLEAHSVDTTGVRKLIMCLTKTLGDDNSWLENILMFLGQKPTDKWLDADRDIAESTLANLSQRINELEKLSLNQPHSQVGSLDGSNVHLLRSVKRGSEAFDKVVVIDTKVAKSIAGVVASMERELEVLDNQELVFAALAKVIDTYFSKLDASPIKEDIINKLQSAVKIS